MSTLSSPKLGVKEGETGKKEAVKERQQEMGVAGLGVNSPTGENGKGRRSEGEREGGGSYNNNISSGVTQTTGGTKNVQQRKSQPSALPSSSKGEGGEGKGEKKLTEQEIRELKEKRKAERRKAEEKERKEEEERARMAALKQREKSQLQRQQEELNKAMMEKKVKYLFHFSSFSPSSLSFLFSFDLEFLFFLILF